MTRQDEVVPDDHCRRMLLEQLLEFMRCPFLYRLKWLEGRQAGPKGYPEGIFRRVAFWACTTELLKSYGLKADEDQVRRVSESIVLQRRTKASADLVAGITDLVWAWWQTTMLGVDEVVRVDTPYAIRIDEVPHGAPKPAATWDLCGTVPLVIREQGRPQPTVVLPLVDYPTGPGWLENDLLVPLTLAGAQSKLGLEVRTIKIQALGQGSPVAAQEPRIDQVQIKRAIQVLGAVRQSVLSSLYAPTWWPNRQGVTCRQDQCPFTAQCIQSFGGTVAP